MASSYNSLDFSPDSMTTWESPDRNIAIHNGKFSIQFYQNLIEQKSFPRDIIPMLVAYCNQVIMNKYSKDEEVARAADILLFLGTNLMKICEHSNSSKTESDMEKMFSLSTYTSKKGSEMTGEDLSAIVALCDAGLNGPSFAMRMSLAASLATEWASHVHRRALTLFNEEEDKED
jgi:hypothetical protein